MAEGGQEINHKIKDIHSREELEDFIHKTVGKEAIPELVEEILSLPSGEIISFVCRQYDQFLVIGNNQSVFSTIRTIKVYNLIVTTI